MNQLFVSADALGSESEHLAGQALLTDRKYFEAMRHFARLLQLDPTDRRGYEGGATALISSVDDASVAGEWDASERHLFYRTLILQEQCDAKPPVLHRVITQYGSDHAQATLSRLGTELEPVLRRIREHGEMQVNVIVLMMLLRETMGAWVSQHEISSLHLEWLPWFGRHELSLLYKSMFDTSRYQKNLDDVAGHFNAQLAAAGDRTDPSLVQLAFFEWLLGEVAHLKDSGIAELITRRSSLNGDLPDEAAAAKSLALRHLDSLEGCDDTCRETFGLNPEFERLLVSVAASRRRLTDELVAVSSGASKRLFHDRRWQRCVAVTNLVLDRAPAVLRGRRRLKVAICISGQLRGYKAVFPTWRRSLLRSVDHQLFVHSWTNIGRSGAEPFRYVLPFEGAHFCAKYREVCFQLGFEEFKLRYPSLFLELTKSAVVTRSAVSSFYQTSEVQLDDDASPPFSRLSNQQKMHQKIHDCHQLVGASGQEFDLIIRLRPDKPIGVLGFEWSHLRQLCHSSPRLFTDHAMGVQFGALMIGDQFAVGAPSTMKIYSQTWSTYPLMAKNGLFQCGEKFDGHTSLAQVCWAHAIAVEKAPIRFGKLEDLEPLAMQAILEAVSADATGRMDAIDHSLLAAAVQDRGNSAVSGGGRRP